MGWDTYSLAPVVTHAAAQSCLWGEDADVASVPPVCPPKLSWPNENSSNETHKNSWSQTGQSAGTPTAATWDTVLWHKTLNVAFIVHVICALTTMRLKKDFVSSSLHSSSFSCSRCAVSATVLRTLLPSGITIGSTPKLTFGINEVIARLLSILRSERTRCSFTAWQADVHFLTWCRYLQFDRQLIPERQHGDTTQYSIHNSQTALQLPPVTMPYSSVHSLSSLC